MIRSERQEAGAILRLVLDAPKANLLDRAMLEAIARALQEGVDRATKLIVFEGAGRHFSFGASVAEHQRDQAAGMLETFHGLFRRLLDLAVPTCAVVRGQCLGGGLELASYCTFLVATPDARLGQPEITLAVFPPMASILLPWRVGGGRALELCVAGRAIDAATAKQIGLVNEVSDDPDGYVRRLFTEALGPASAIALRFAERAARGALARRIEEELPHLERLYLDELMATHDANEGIGAFLERRAPQWTNR